MNRTIEHQAARGMDLTLDQLAAFVQEAMRAGVAGSMCVKARVSFGGYLRAVSVQAPVTKAVEK